MRGWLVVLGVLAAGCGGPPPLQDHLEKELKFLHVGVDPVQEAREVRASFAQRGMRVVTHLQGARFQALAARSPEASAVRVITSRGIAVAEDARSDDLFRPEYVQLLGTGPGEPAMLVVVRRGLGQSLGCGRVYRVHDDGNALPQRVDVSSFGDLACLAGAEKRARGLTVRLAWPALSAGGTVPELEVPFRWETVRLDQPEPLVRRAAPAGEGEWLNDAREALSCTGAFADRQAVGVARAALALAAGSDVEAQLAAYSTCLAQTAATGDPVLIAATRAHIGQGWLEAAVLDQAPRGQEEEEGREPGGASGLPQQQGAEAVRHR